MAPAVMALALAAFAPALSAQALDFTVSKVEVNQAVQTGTTPLTAGRATFARASVRVNNPPPAPPLVDGLLRIYVNGVEADNSPVYSDNGPFPAKSPIDPSVENGTLNFIFLAPQGPNVVLTVEVNPAGPNFLPEANTSNNVFTNAPLSFQVLGTPELAYVPIDYRPSGGTVPNLPSASQIEPGMGDNFVQGIFPSADWYYHRTDAPSKLWTSSLSGTGSNLLNALQVDINLMVPKPDFLYGFVPGGLPYNGQSFLPGNVSMGNSELIRYQRTIAHEMGHNVGLQHNTLTTGVIGVDVEHHLHLTQDLPQLKSATLKDIMYAGLLTQEAWVAPSNYNYFFNHAVFDPPAATAVAADESPMLMLAGLWNPEAGTIEVTDVLTLPSAAATLPASPRDANLVVRTYVGGTLLTELPLAARTSADECAACRADADPVGDVGDCADAAADASVTSDVATAAPAGAAADSALKVDPVVPFTAIVPLSAAGLGPVNRIVVAPAGSTRATPLERQRTPWAPKVAFTSPVNGAVGAGKFVVTWTGSDADGDTLRYYLRYSPDGGKRFVPLASCIETTSVDVDLASLPAPVPGKACFELFASDGLNTTVIRTQPLSGTSALLGAGNDPWVQLITPDSGFAFQQGATVILHSSGWDLEDRALDGESLQWSSNLSGPLGSGRLTSVTDLAVGQHVLTVTATDSNGMVATDTATITILPRALPITEPVVCQTDLGFGGPGASVLTLCGGDLSTGTSADLLLTGGPAFSQAFLIVGLTNAPTPVKGGMLVPNPSTLVVLLSTDGDGAISIPGIQGGNGPASFYLQCVLMDGNQAQGFGFSNALKVNLLP